MSAIMKFFNRFRSASAKDRGFILPIILVTGFVIVLIIVAVTGELVSNNSNASHGYYAVEAQMAADAGLDASLNSLNTGGTGVISETTLLSDSVRNLKTTYQVDVTDGADSNHKTLTVTARSYSPISAASPRVTRKYLMDIEAVTSGTGPSSIVTGVGGLIMNGNSKVTGGDVVVDGTITMNNGSQIGLSTNPVNVRVADQACPSPADTNYPRVCDSTLGDTITNPITVGATARIYADVIATNQTDGTNMSNDGLQAGQKFDPVPLTSFDRTGFKNTVTASGVTMTGTDASNCPSGGTVNWPANVKIIGDVNIQNKCTIKVNGNVWVTGSVTIKNNANMAIQDSVGTTMPYLVVDGSSGFVLGNNGSITPNVSGTSIEILTFYSTGSCSPDCSTLTGSDLYNSQHTLTINLSNTGYAPGAILYAYWSEVQLSNNSALGAVTGQTVVLGNNAVINFTSSVPGSSNLITTWVKRGYMRVYN